MDQNQFVESGNSPPPLTLAWFRGKRFVEAIKPRYDKCFHGLPDRYCSQCLENPNPTKICVHYLPESTCLRCKQVGRPDPKEQEYVHTDEGRCYCKKCVDDVRNPKPRPQKHQDGFCKQMLAYGFKDGDGVLPKSDFIDDCLFLLSRINSLGVKDFQAVSKLIRDSSPIEPKPLDRRLGSATASYPLLGTAFTSTPDHWFPTYWRKADARITPNNTMFHEQLLNEIEKVELNHDLPSGETRSYSFAPQAHISALSLHWVDSRFEDKPYMIDDANATFAELVPFAAPEEWAPPRIQVEYKRDKKVITNVRCRVCGALDKQKYPGSVALCRVDLNYLCNRKACIRARSYNAAFDSSRLSAGYPLHQLFVPLIHKSVFGWAHSNERNESDPNLKCELRYDLDRRGRKGVKPPKAKDREDWKKAVAQPARIHTAEDIDVVIRYAEDIFHATLVEPIDLVIKTVEYDETIHRVVGDLFEERRHVPNYNCFALNSFVGRKKPLYFDSGSNQVPCRWVDAFIIQGTAPYHVQEYRDPGVSKLDEIKTWEALKEEFRRAKLKWYDPNKLHSSIITLWKGTTGAADEVRLRQLGKVKKLKACGRIEKFIEDIYLDKKSMKRVAKEQKTTPGALKQKAYRYLNKPILSENETWSLVAQTCKKDGLYTVATIGGQTRAYLLSATVEPKSSLQDAILSGLDNTIRGVLYRRAKKRTIEEHEFNAAYGEIYSALCRLPWRLLRDGKWYDRIGELVVSSTR